MNSTDRRGHARANALATAALLVGGMAAFGTATPVSRVVSRSFPVFLAAGLRMAIAAIALLPLAARARRRHSGSLRETLVGLSRRDWGWIGAISVVGTFLFSVLMVLGMREVPGAVGAIIMAMTPAVTAVGATVLFSERLTRPRAAAIVLGVTGVIVVNLASAGSADAGNLVLGTLFVIGAVCSEAVYSLSAKKLTVDLDPLTIAACAATLATLLFSPLAVWSAVGFAWSSPTGGEWVAMAWWGLGTMALGSAIWFAGLQRVEGTVAAPYMAVMPATALIGSYVILREAFDPWHLVGIAAVVVGVVLVQREHTHKD